MPATSPDADLALRRARARRLALWLGALAALVFVGFIVLNVVSR